MAISGLPQLKGRYDGRGRISEVVSFKKRVGVLASTGVRSQF